MNYRVKGRFVSGGGREVVAGMRGVRHTSEKKRKETTCAERRGRRNERSSAHVRKEKSKKFSRKTGKGTKYIIQQVTIKNESE